jgi:hemerythrin-like domain-containing protein
MLPIHRKRDATPAFIPDFGDPLGLLVHCHAKIEAQLGALERAADSLRAGPTDALRPVREAIEAARAHFAGPGAKHTADEEESLFPRIRARCGAADAGVLAALDALEAQHRVVEEAHAGLDAVLARVVARDDAAPSDVAAFGAGVAELVALYRPHMALENEVVFPAAARLLTPDELAAVGGEMRRRRGM